LHSDGKYRYGGGPPPPPTPCHPAPPSPVPPSPWIIKGISEAVDAQRFEQAFSLARLTRRLPTSAWRGWHYYRNIPGGRRLPQVAATTSVTKAGAMLDADVPLLRQRLAMTGGGPTKTPRPAVSSKKQDCDFFCEYDETIGEAGPSFSAHHLLRRTYRGSNKTRNAFNVSVDQETRQ